MIRSDGTREKVLRCTGSLLISRRSRGIPTTTYETVKEGTNRLVCYDRSGEPGRRPFAVQCTSVGNLDRVAQNRRFQAESENAEAMQAMLDAAAGERNPR